MTPDASQPNLKSFEVSHLGLNLRLAVLEDPSRLNLVWMAANFGYLPKQGIAALYRGMLSDTGANGAFFKIDENLNLLTYMLACKLGDIDPTQLLIMLDAFCRAYWQWVPKLIQEFQIPQQPS